MAPNIAAEEESENLIELPKSISPISHPHPQKLRENCGTVRNSHNSFLRFAKFIIVGFPYIALLICLNSRDIRASELSDESTHQLKHHANTTGYVRPNVIYGHVHIAKAGGTTLNGIFANKFERVCGHKGYSYDAYQQNEKAKKVEESGGKKFRGSVGVKADKYMLGEVGFEDCDYISQEKEYTYWHKNFPDGKFLGVPVELHVPCRDPVDHLLSQCNFRAETRRLPCNSDPEQSGALYSAIEDCILSADRFHRSLTETFSVKCFDFRKQFTEYTSYMSTTLQSRRFEVDRVVGRMTNKPRNKTDECIWDHPDLLEKTRNYLMYNLTSDNEKRKGNKKGGKIILSDYYRFCDECMGSKDDLTRGATT